MKYRVAIIYKEGHKAENFNTREKVDEFILKNGATKFRIAKDGEIIETEQGIK